MESTNRRGAPPLLGLEALHHTIAFRRRRAAVQEERLAAECGFQMRLQRTAHLGVLGEDERAVIHGERFFKHLGQADQFAAASGKCAAVMQEERGVIADLLELGERGQDLTTALKPSDSLMARNCS